MGRCANHQEVKGTFHTVLKRQSRKGTFKRIIGGLCTVWRFLDAMARVITTTALGSECISQKEG